MERKPGNGTNFKTKNGKQWKACPLINVLQGDVWSLPSRKNHGIFPFGFAVPICTRQRLLVLYRSLLKKIFFWKEKWDESLPFLPSLALWGLNPHLSGTCSHPLTSSFNINFYTLPWWLTGQQAWDFFLMQRSFIGKRNVWCKVLLNQ